MWRPCVRASVRKQSRTVPYLLVCRTYTSRATVPYCTVHKLTCRVDMAELRWVCVLYCTALHVDTGALIFSRIAFGMRSRFVRNLFGMHASCLPLCMTQAGSRYSYQYGTSYHEYSYISRTRTRGRSYGTELHYMYIREPSFSDGMHSRRVRYAFGMRSKFVRDACLPACLPAACG